MTLGGALLQYLFGYLCIGWGVVSATLVAALRVNEMPRDAKDWLSVFLAWILWPLFLWFLVKYDTTMFRDE